MGAQAMNRDDDLRPSGESVMRASAAVWRLFVEGIPEGWMIEEPAGVAVVTGLDSPTENGVLALTHDASASAIDALLERIAATGLPHHLQLRGGMDADVLELPRRRGMELEGEEQAMVLDDFSALHAAAHVPDLTIRTLPSDRIDEHADVVEDVFGSPPEVVNALMNPRVMSYDGVRCYVGEVGGEPVCTGFAVTHRGATGIFSVATRPSYRRRGYGAALTARAALDGAAAGARWAWLQSSENGRRVYERLGFVAVETQPLWLAR